MRINALPVSKEVITTFCQKWGVREFALFGSVLREDFRPTSDIDVLFSMRPGAPLGFNEYFDMKEELERLFGRPVDFVERKLIEESPNFVRRREILSTVEVIYAE